MSCYCGEETFKIYASSELSIDEDDKTEHYYATCQTCASRWISGKHPWLKTVYQIAVREFKRDHKLSHPCLSLLDVWSIPEDLIQKFPEHPNYYEDRKHFGVDETKILHGGAYLFALSDFESVSESDYGEVCFSFKTRFMRSFEIPHWYL